MDDTAQSSAGNDTASDRERALARTFVELADTMVTRFDIDEYLHLLCERAHDILEVHAAGVLLEDEDGALRLTAASTMDAAALDLFEMQARQGPCYDAYSSGDRVQEVELANASGRWPSFVPMALEAGFRSVYAFPLRVRDTRIGAMNLFRRELGHLEQEDVVVAQSLADVACIAIVSQRQQAELDTVSSQLQYALDSRVLIEQAKGIVAERHEVSPDRAFNALRQHARGNNATLRSVAQAIVEGQLAGVTVDDR